MILKTLNTLIDNKPRFSDIEFSDKSDYFVKDTYSCICLLYYTLPWMTLYYPIKVHSFCKQCLHKDLVFINWQLMSALASLERFGEEDLVFINWRSCRHCLQNEWPLLSYCFTNVWYANRRDNYPSHISSRTLVSALFWVTNLANLAPPP